MQMQTFKWLYQPATSFNWKFVRNVLLKAVLLFIVINLIFILTNPLPAIGHLTIYNWLIEGRNRLPYGESPSESYNLSLYQIDAMFASHDISVTDENEFRVVVLGDSSIWGILLRPEETLAGQITAGDYQTASGQKIRAYNLGYPTMSLTKDLMMLDYAMQFEPDLIVWSFTLESFGLEAQLGSSIAQNNPERIRNLIRDYNLSQDPNDSRFETPNLWDKTIMGRRRELADILRLQFYGVLWDVTNIDQTYPVDYNQRATDLESDESWQGYEPGELSTNDLAFDVLAAGIERADNIPLLLINEPMMISEGENSDIRYNTFFPRWAYDFYRTELLKKAESENWHILDLWDILPRADCYTDSPVHLTAECAAREATIIGPILKEFIDTGSIAQGNLDQ